MNTKLNFSKEDITFNGTENEKKLKEKLFDDSLLIAQKDEEIERLNKTLEETQRSYTYELLEAKKSKPLVFSEVREVHKGCMRKAKERHIERIKGGKR